MKLLGYSERGILNSLLYEIRYADNGDALLGQLIDEARFPFTDKPSSGSATVFVEQSFSDFGDADAVILIESDAKKCAIFVEAKVQAGASKWRICNQFDKFKEKVYFKGRSSNVFTQLYHKQRFVEGSMDEIKQGIEFPKWSFRKDSSKSTRKIGCNPVVLRAVDQIKNHLDTTFFLMLVPDNDECVENFFDNTLCNSRLKVPKWDVSHYGYLTWATVEAFCEQNQLNDTLDVFKHNGDQIYRKP